MFKKVLLAAILTALLFSLVGCQTLQGLGKDIEWVGQQMGNAVE
jgi:predicted small secreted protein